MQSILIRSEPNTRDAVITELWECGTTGVLEDSDTVRAFFESDSTLPQIMDNLSCPVLEIRHETSLAEVPDVYENRDPLYAGRQFFVVSSGMDDPTPAGRTRLVIDAADAFGSGSHESTQLMIQALEEHLFANATVADVGCGSGILSAIAEKLGAVQTIACDIHMGALEAARKHAPHTCLFAGSADALKTSLADIVMVNIGAAVIDLLAYELCRIVKPTGLLIVSGFTADRVPIRIRPEKVLRLNDWFCWLCRPQDTDLNQPQPQEAVQPFPVQWW